MLPFVYSYDLKSAAVSNTASNGVIEKRVLPIVLALTANQQPHMAFKLPVSKSPAMIHGE